jgi:hypothetical protein
VTLTGLHLRFRDEAQRRRSSEVVMDRLVDAADEEEECDRLLRFWWQVMLGGAQVTERELAASVRADKLAVVEGLILAAGTAPEAVDAWIESTVEALPEIGSLRYFHGWRTDFVLFVPGALNLPPPLLPAPARAPRPREEELAGAEEAHAAGRPGAAYELGRILELRGEPCRAAAMFRLAGESGDPAALYAAGRAVRAAGAPGYSTTGYWKHAADLGHVEAMYGFAALDGPNRGLRYLRQAAALGHADACYALGYDAYVHAEFDTAEAWWTQGARRGSPFATVALTFLSGRR